MGANGAQGGDLSERKKLILKAIIEAHIEGGEPVGSKFLMQSKQIACSSATIRNEMAELEQLGYLEQPHTSAGRIPSELGYRFYVDQLLQSYSMTTSEIAQINNMLRAKLTELDQILSMASKVVSSLTNYTGLVIKPKTAAVSVARFDAVWIDDSNFILIMLTSTGVVKSKYIRLGFPITEDILENLKDTLNRCFSGVAAEEITLSAIMKLEEEMGVNSAIVNPIMKCIYEALNEIDGGEMKVSGINRLLQYPEYSDQEKLSQLLSTLENEDEILELVSNAENDDINVIIGSETSVKVMDQSAIVFKPIKRGGRTLGVIGVIGPRRMDYARVLATIDEISGNIEVILDDNKLLSEGEKNAGRTGKDRKDGNGDGNGGSDG